MRRLLTAFGVLVLLALSFFAGLYLFGDNELSVADRACEGAVTKAAGLEALAKGEVAAFQVATKPMNTKDFAFEAEGEPVTLADWQGQTLLVNLWATWCAPCREEMPALDRLEAQLGGESFEVVAVSMDLGSDEKPREFLQEIKADNLAFYHDPEASLFQAVKASALSVGLPVTLLVGPDGCMLGHMAGPAAWDSSDAIALVQGAVEMAE